MFSKVFKQRWFPWAVNGVVALFVALSIMQKAAKVLESKASPARPATSQAFSSEFEPDIRALIAASLFGEAPVSSAKVPDVVTPTALNFTLKGVIVSKDSGLAFISTQGNFEEPFALGQEIAPGTILFAVQSDRVVLRRNMQFETLMLEGMGLVENIQLANNGEVITTQLTSTHGSATRPLVVSRKSLRAQVQSPHELLSQAILVPSSGGGFLLQEIQSGSLIEQFGLRPGDIVRSANGQMLRYPDDIRRVYERLASSTRLKLELDRHGKQEELSYEIVE